MGTSKEEVTHCILNRLSHTIYWKCPISILGTSGYEIYIFQEKNGKTICKQWRPWSVAAFSGVLSGSALFANYPFAASDLGLHCLPITLLRVSRLQWVNEECIWCLSKFFFWFSSKKYIMCSHLNWHNRPFKWVSVYTYIYNRRNPIDS